MHVCESENWFQCLGLVFRWFLTSKNSGQKKNKKNKNVLLAIFVCHPKILASVIIYVHISMSNVSSLLSSHVAGTPLKHHIYQSTTLPNVSLPN